MSLEVLLIGLTRESISLGLALASAEGDVTRVGFDPEKSFAQKAEKMGAVDKIVSHPRKVATSADIIIFSLPASEAQVYLVV